MKSKSNHKKNKKEEEVDVTKEIGVFNDFVIYEKKEPEKKKEEKNDLSFLDDWVMLENPFSEKTSKNKSKKSRFSDLFEQIKEGQKKSKEEENIKNDDSLNKSSINTSSTTINCDSKSFEGNSINSINSINDSSLSENSSNNQNKENIKNEQGEKNEKNEKIDEKNMILDINKVISMEDKRTTIMIKNIPNKFNKDLLLSIINQNFKGTYDLFILPTDINKYKNFGYAFINFTSSYYIPYFYYMFNGKMWSSTNSKKICELTYSKVQGKTNLLGHYPSKIVYGNEEAKNVIPEQKYIIPNVYKIIFNKLFPKEKIEEFKFYFITKMPEQK